MAQPRPSHRAGFSYRSVLLILALASVAALVAWLMAYEVDWSPVKEGPLMHTVNRGGFLHEIVESGEVESASNVDIRCEVKSRGAGGITILWVIDDGEFVRPGDELVRFDSSALENELNQQKIVCSNSEAAVETARNELAAAEIAKKEYLEGVYVLEHNLIEVKKFMAREAQRQAEQNLRYSEGLAKKGYVTDLRVETDKIAVDKAKLDYQSAELELKVHKKYTREKQLKLLESTIGSARARLRSAEATHQLDVEQRELIESQIAKCTIYAKNSGQVVYANEYRRHGGQDIVIEAGTMVREQQSIIRLPDPKRMQVKAKINEAKIAMVAPGMPVTIHLDAFPDREFEGTVERVSPRAAPSGWFAGNVKQYETFVKILGSPEGLKPGLTAEVRIQVERLPNVLQVPVQAIFEHAGKYYCVMRDGDGWRAHQVKIGSTNDKFVVIRERLKKGDEIVLGAFAYRDEVDLPKVAKDAQAPPPSRPVAEPSPSKTPDAPAAAAKNKPPPEGKKLPDPFAQFDRNGNGKIEKSEAPEPMQQFFSKIDKDSDGAISRAEWAAVRQMMRQRQRGQGEPPGANRP